MGVYPNPLLSSSSSPSLFLTFLLTLTFSPVSPLQDIFHALIFYSCLAVFDSFVFTFPLISVPLHCPLYRFFPLPSLCVPTSLSLSLRDEAGHSHCCMDRVVLLWLGCQWICTRRDLCLQSLEYDNLSRRLVGK